MADWDVSLEDLEDGEPVRDPVEPGSPSLENVVFVTLGVLLAVGTLVALAL